MKLLVSIHDVTPATLDRVGVIFDRLRRAGLLPVTLLVVPGARWDEAGLARLRELFAAGAVPAGHGWHHRARCIRGIRHRLHAALISRNAAEHLALSRRGILRLMERNHRWFSDHDLPVPSLYVPPAWAMGPVPRRFLDRLPFARYETLAGVYDAPSKRFVRLPMAGFEADTAPRAAFVRPFNALNRALARVSGRPLRLGIHPDDFDLRLAGDLERALAAGGEALDYSVLGAASSPA
ncbi:MAG: polysaccharide deacetylase family protein [Wenzhouxiangellaceae bacterium]|nr:polysaccharide deacetylase family protein [Wenzhouxiangellaceae bacterium]